MIIVKRIALGFFALMVLLALASFALPRTYKVERSIDIDAPMHVVYPLVFDPKAWTRWGVWYRRDPGMQITYTGAPAGVGAKWAWQSKPEGSGSMEITTAEFNKLVGYKIAMDDFDGAMSGRIEFALAGKAVRVRWIAEGDVGGNPLMRYFAVIMDRMLGPDFEGGLKNLKALAETPQ